MKIYAAHGHMYFNGVPHGVTDGPFPKVAVIDLRSGDEIQRCRFADDETGEYEHFPSPPGNRRLFKLDANRNPIRERGITPLRIEVRRCSNPECRPCSHLFPNVSPNGKAYETKESPRCSQT